MGSKQFPYLQAIFLLLAGILFSSAPAYANEVPLFDTEIRFPVAVDDGSGKIRVAINSTTLDLQVGDTLSVTFPDKNQPYSIPILKTTRHTNNDLTLLGELEQAGEAYRLHITVGASGASGFMETPQGKYVIEAQDDSTWLLTPTVLESYQPTPFGDDAPVPNIEPGALPQTAIDAEPAAPAGMAQVDIMILYTTALKSRLGSNLQTRLNQLVSVSNQAYIDSEISVELRLVHSEETTYSNTSSTALNDVTNGAGVLSGVAATRAAKGADFVIMLRDYTASHTNCGVAWRLGDSATGTMPNSHRSHGYGIVQDGTYPAGGGEYYYCSDYTFAHELGHNFGSHHDRDHALDQYGNLEPGVFPYSYGHDSPDTFATIMSYDSPEIGKFSNPDISCNGLPCGIAEGNANSADNARSINNIRHDIAAFYDAPADQDNDGVADTTDNCPTVSNADQTNTDGDQYGNACDDDDDNDGMTDTWENDNNLNPLDDNDADLDPDNDGLSNKQEFDNNTNPNVADSDGDGMNDGDEINAGRNPNDPSDSTNTAVNIIPVIMEMLLNE